MPYTFRPLQPSLQGILMAATATQANRLMALAVEGLGPDDLLLTQLSGEESISDLFSFRLHCVSETPQKIKLDAILNKRASIRVRLNDGSDRYFNGFVSSATCDGQQPGDKRFMRYFVEVVPWLWALTRTRDCRIFQNKSVPDIIQQIFKDLGFNDFKLELMGSFEPRDYCVQYRETDFQFVSRLMEEEGIFYYFQHEKSKHSLVLVNSNGSCKACPKAEKVLYDPEQGIGEREDRIFSWSERSEWRSGKFTYRDHHFAMPHKDLDYSVPTANVIGGNDKFDLYDYPGRYAMQFHNKDGTEGKAETLAQSYVRLRIQEEEAQHKGARGESNCRAFFTGAKFKFEGAPGFTAGEYLLTSVHHACLCQVSYVSGEEPEETYSNQFTCVPMGVPYRPRRTTAKPIVHGSQTAVVRGLAGEEIDTDKYGRVKVQFHWDREGKNDENSSCWVRVGTPLAGKNWGMIHIPRIGQEVIVDFLEGDPDQPIIIGSVYNADQMPPYALPANKTQSGIVSRSSLEGSPENFNEICFEDRKGQEFIYIRAEKDQIIAVENDEAHWVGHDREKTIDHDETTLVHHDRTETVDNNETITIHGNRTEEVDKDETITIHKNRTETVDKDETISIGKSRTETVGKDETITIADNRTESVGKDENISIGGGRTESVGKDESISIGGARSHSVGKSDALSVGKALSITAADSITLSTGAASITMKKDGTITISGKDITIDASGKLVGKAGGTVTLKGQKIMQN
jgi:type VI secretion system secreted protein VgrG